MKKEYNRDFILIKSDILKCFQKKPTWYRKEIINDCLKNFTLSNEERNDSSSDSQLVQCKSLIGTVISYMINNNILSIDNGKVLTLGAENQIVLNQSQIEIYIKNLFTLKSAYTLNEIVSSSENYFKTNATKTLKDDKILIDYINIIIKKLLSNSYINQVSNQFVFNTPNRYPNTEIGNCLNECFYIGNTFDCFIKAINIKGGEFFEVFSVKLMEKYFRKCHSTVITSRVTGGSNDDGLDGIIETIDDLGYYEKIFMQMKARNRVDVTVKEVREFYGALVSEKGTRGIFVTNSNYHYLALEFFKKANNLIGIDGKTLYKIACECNYGIINYNDKLILDERVFL